MSNTCVDIDECAEKNEECSQSGAICINTHASYVCECPKGYTWNAQELKCKDVDECALETEMSSTYETLCDDDHSTCVNTIGSYYCECNDGWNRTDLIYCTGKIILFRLFIFKKKAEFFVL